ncbi:Potassium channel [Anaerolineae bacterium]|nr:Potassium channel [Anaerolineae bacterium]
MYHATFFSLGPARHIPGSDHTTMTNVHPESRKEFQLERLILFTDAVFAIAITLLIIEIKVPELTGNEATEGALISYLGHLIPRFAGFFISFMLIGMYWTRHHFLFGFVIDYTPKLIWLNMLFLLSIVLMPFSTGLFGEFSTPATIHLKTPLIFYVANVCATGFLLYFLWAYIGNPANGVASQALTPGIVHDAKQRALVVSLVFALTIGMAMIDTYASRYFPILTPVFLRVAKRLFPGTLSQTV